MLPVSGCLLPTAPTISHRPQRATLRAIQYAETAAAELSGYP
jgi:hypothetical protein